MAIPAQKSIPFARDGQKNALPNAGLTTDENASYQYGFPPRTMADDATAVPPTGEDMNGILNQLSEASIYQQSGGFYPFNGTYAQAIGGYPKGALVLNSDFSGFWFNTTDNNMTNPDTGGAGWKSLGGSSSHNLCEVVMSLLPMSDAGLHLLDGSVLTAGGIYDGFVQYVGGLETSYPNAFVTESEWQSQYANKGSCGKFVVSRNSNGALSSVRLPKITDILQGTSDPTAVGDMLDAGLPNITGKLGIFATFGNSSAEGALSVTNTGTTGSPNNIDKAGDLNLTLDASRSSPIYGRSTTVQQQAIKALFYICVATTAKTDIEVNIDNIATDLNNKLSKSGGDITGRTTIAATDWVVTTTVANAAGVHNSIFRGKYLGSSITEAQSAAIRAGTFDDLYIGDYWIINNVKYVIVAFDFYLHTGDTECITHHIVVVPEKALYQAQMNSSNTTEGAYVGSAMYKTNLNSAKSTILAAFGSSHLLSIRQYFQNAMANAIPTGGIWTDVTVFLMSEMNVYGCRIYGAVINGTNWPTLYTTDNRQYPYFAMNNLLQTRNDFWLRDVCSAYDFANVASDGNATYFNASYSLGVRPAFCVI